MTPIRFSEADFYDSKNRLVANCGPGALAAIAGMSLKDLMRDIPDFHETGGLTFERMKAELTRLGMRWRLHGDEWPPHGVAIIGWMERDRSGPQICRHTKFTNANRRRHWVAVSGRMIFDPFAANKGWLPENEWKRSVLPRLTGHRDFEWPICRIDEALWVEARGA